MKFWTCYLATIGVLTMLAKLVSAGQMPLPSCMMLSVVFFVGGTMLMDAFEKAWCKFVTWRRQPTTPEGGKGL